MLMKFTLHEKWRNENHFFHLILTAHDQGKFQPVFQLWDITPRPGIFFTAKFAKPRWTQRLEGNGEVRLGSKSQASLMGKSKNEREMASDFLAGKWIACAPTTEESAVVSRGTA